MNLGENMKIARKAAKMNQTELAEAIGVTQKDISRWEKNLYTPSTTTFRNICIALNVSADELLELK